MLASPVFPRAELDQRLEALRRLMAFHGLDGLVLSVPESIYYLTGLDHWGFFACHLLIVPLDGEVTLVARRMESITAANLVTNARFLGHADHEDPVDYAVGALQELGLARGCLGLELRSLFITPRIADGLREKTPGAAWLDASGLADGLRLVKSPLETAYIRRAAAAADAGTLAAIESIRDGASDHEVAAECHRAMILAGSEYPGFGPFIRPTTRLGEEHTTWRGDVFRSGDAVFLELAAAYRKYQAPMGRLVYIGRVPAGIERSVQLAVDGMQAICAALRPGLRASQAYAAWREVAQAAGLTAYERHHCGYAVGIGFPPSWTGGSMVTSLAPTAEWDLQAGMVFHAHSWFTNTDCADYFISNTVLVTEAGCEVLTRQTPETLMVR